MRAKLIGQSPEYYKLYEILRKLERFTQLAPFVGWNTGGGGAPPISPEQQAATAFIQRVEADGGVTEAEACLISRIKELMDAGFWDQASAVWLPHGYKEGKLYAVKGGISADLGFTRAGNRVRQSATYLETLNFNIPALDYTGSICPSLSLEPGRTNLLLRSNAFDDASWTKLNLTPTANATAGPDNLSTADQLLETVTNDLHEVTQSLTKAAAATKYAISVSVKSINRGWISLTARNGVNGVTKYFDISNGIVGSTVTSGSGFTLDTQKITTEANGFYRCEIAITTDATTAVTAALQVATADSTNSYAGNIVNGIYAYEMQLEAGRYVTSPIHTDAGTVNRIPDIVTPLTAVSDLIGQTEGTMYYEIDAIASAEGKIFAFGDGTDSNRIWLFLNSSNQIAMIITSVGVTSVNMSTVFTTGHYKIAAVYRNNYAAYFINGIKAGEDLSVVVPAVSNIYFDQNGSGGSALKGNIQCIAISKTAISDAEAISLTTP